MLEQEVLAVAQAAKDASPALAQATVQERNAALTAMARALRELLGPCRQALVVGLGNRDITPDAIGPEAVKNLIVTRHLQAGQDEALPGLMRVAACQPGVLGQTGIESLELVKCAMQTAQPDVVIVIDALAAAEPGRLFRTVQLSDSGIVPGSGVGNSRQEFSRRTLGVPVIAVGVPTVVDAISLFRQAELELDVPQGVLVFGEVGLTGEVRRVSAPERRIMDGVNLGFTKFVVPDSKIELPKDVRAQIVRVKTLEQAMSAIFG